MGAVVQGAIPLRAVGALCAQWVVGWTAWRGWACSPGACAFKHAHVTWSEGLVLRWFLLPASGVKIMSAERHQSSYVWCLGFFFFYGPVNSGSALIQSLAARCLF